MAHGGKKTRFGPVRRLGFVARRRQRHLRLLALGDIAADALHLDDIAVSVAHREILKGIPAWPARCFQDLVIGASPRQDGAIGAGAEYGGQGGGALAGKFACRHSQRMHGGIIGKADLAPAIAAQDEIALGVDQVAVARLAFAQLPGQVFEPLYFRAQ